MEYDKKIENRLKRIEGQLRGVIKMVEADGECRDVVTQLSAVRSAVDRTIGVIVSENLQSCVRDSLEKGESTEDVVKEAVELLVKSR
ncbi:MULTISPECIES: metal-sensitive transcriptional regulator [Planococcus]|uniref:Cytoplasmic protein n=2 Tax=Planococcus TaxID=1372 RepID=A0A0U2YT94_9BACL|nr:MULTISPECIES: metal-sensitive transcriptional regulator [Planococcus]MDE4085508.1 metal-sensitive transcriptional regulator [Planococcus maritimus]ALS76045.1 cytoplasmic protein [Planococcus rifietoensis]AUD14809.1 cytoplasmic protein [Planococcus sp. MB-3u-03]PKG45127.1 cytoplasmic protein [Planococcus sp. Urea-trap-24]PKG87469.1 cytoplasmic protein [Planococcus sp. Urea-3u-39]